MALREEELPTVTSTEVKGLDEEVGCESTVNHFWAEPWPRLAQDCQLEQFRGKTSIYGRKLKYLRNQKRKTRTELP